MYEYKLQMNNINLDLIKSQIYTNVYVRNQIIQDFVIQDKLNNDIDSFFNNVLSSLNQYVQPIKRDISNIQVFEAAVKSIASNMRNWEEVIVFLGKLKEYLFDYNYNRVYEFHNKQEYIEGLKSILTGQSSSNDATAILKWSEILSLNNNYYENILKLISYLESKNCDEKQIFMNTVAIFSEYCKNRELLHDVFPEYFPVKFPGMLIPLSTEFLRNLGWNGFKPDRHIVRLFTCWYGLDDHEAQHETNEICKLMASRNKEMREKVYFSFIGYKYSPNTVYSQVDNIVWLFGKYIMTKGKEAKIG